MGTDSDLPRINEVANFLIRYAPRTHATLAARGSEIAALIQPGMIGGKQPAPDDEWNDLSTRAEVVIEALPDAIQQAQSGLITAMNRLKTLRRVRYVSAVLAATASSGVIAAAFVGRTATLAAGSVNLISVVSTLTAEHLVLGGKASEQIYREAAATLTKVIDSGRLILKLLRALLSPQSRAADIKGVVRDANQLFYDLSQALSLLNSMT